MLKFIFKRLLEALPTLFILITFSFFLMRLAPGSPFTSERAYPPEVMANIEAKYHLNEPLHKQYFLYLENLSKGDFGPSFKYKDQSVNDLIASAFPVSLKLGMVAFAFAVVLGVTAGTLAALNQNSRWDYILMSFSMLGVIMPSFVFAPVLVLIFAIYLGWLPAGGWNGGSAMYIILPVASLTIAYVAGIARIMRGSMIEVLHSNFIRTAKAKGLSTSRIILKHTGSMVIESVFGLPGMGLLFVNGALNRDYSLVLSLTILVGTLTILFNAIVDILYAIIDPKIRY